MSLKDYTGQLITIFGPVLVVPDYRIGSNTGYPE
jgi:hypothetical protein